MKLARFLVPFVTAVALMAAGPLVDKKALTVETAKKMADAAEKFALSNKWAMVITILDEGGNLVVDGYYATTPWRVSFHLTFIMEGRSWKLVGINVSAKPPPAPDPSSPEVSGEPIFQSL